MKWARWRAWTALALSTACGLTAAACSRADLDAITRPGAGDGGGNDGTTPVTCPSPALRPGDAVQTLTVQGVSRSYVLHVPAAYDGSKPVPLVVDFHPMPGSGMQERTSSPYPSQVDPEGALMAFPTGLAGPSGNSWNVGPCCVPAADDLAFARALVAHAATVACVDGRRIYATGFSMGGGMAHHVACHAADLFAAVAPASFDLLQENAGDCHPARPITVIAFRGSADTLVPYDGGYSAYVPGMPVTFLGAQATFAKWAGLDGCSGAPSAPDGAGCASYSSCAGGVEVVLCTKAGSGQVWGDPAIAWPVLKRHRLP